LDEKVNISSSMSVKARMQVLLIIEFYLQMSLMLGDDTCNVLQRVNGVLDSLNTGTATPNQVKEIV
jgi:hypothetical protein